MPATGPSKSGLAPTAREKPWMRGADGGRRKLWGEGGRFRCNPGGLLGRVVSGGGGGGKDRLAGNRRGGLGGDLPLRRGGDVPCLSYRSGLVGKEVEDVQLTAKVTPNCFLKAEMCKHTQSQTG